eukprot:SAG22_NODE_8513_length_649_cov_1.874545_1_plen_147_part_00
MAEFRKEQEAIRKEQEAKQAAEFAAFQEEMKNKHEAAIQEMEGQHKARIKKAEEACARLRARNDMLKKDKADLEDKIKKDKAFLERKHKMVADLVPRITSILAAPEHGFGSLAPAPFIPPAPAAAAGGFRFQCSPRYLLTRQATHL